MSFLKNWTPVAIWAGFIFYMSGKEGVNLPSFPYSDKMIHICVYAMFGFFVARALARAHGLEAYKIIIITALLAGFYGMTDEIHQTFVSTRSAELLDLIADFLGGFLGSLFPTFSISTSQRHLT